MKLKFSARLLRTLLALIVSGVLMYNLMLIQAEADKNERELAFNLTAVSWKVSETIFEAKRLEVSLRGYHAGRTDRDTVVMQTELLWSRLGVLRGENLPLHDKIVASLAGLEQILTDWEHPIYEAPELGPDEALALADLLTQQAAEIRSLWIADFLSDRDAMLAAGQINADARSELMADFLVAGLILYMIAELYWATRAQQREVRLRKEATAANEAKSAFLANVSHEIRTPLNGILGMAQELNDSPLSEDQKELVNVIIGAGELLVSTIDDVLDISKIEAGRLVMEEVLFDPVQCLRHSVDLHRHRARDKDLELNLRIDPKVPSKISGDPLRLGQVMNNLISNALKFTQEGSIDAFFTAHPIEGEPDKIELSISVRDTGIGLSEDVMEKIFEPFTQADAGTTRKAGGTGLGLTICRTICRQMGGDLTVSSKLGEGSTFVATFRLVRADGATAALPELMARPRILSPASGLDATRHEVLPDITAEPLVQTTPLITEIQSHPDQSENQDKTAVAISSPNLLLVDDSRTNRMVIQRFLKDRAGQIIEAENGEAAVEAALANKFDLILMDIQMPIMDGVEATRRIRAYERENGLPSTPIIAVTANVMVHQIQEYHDNGMDKVIAKPVKKAEILGLLEDFQRNQAA